MKGMTTSPISAPHLQALKALVDDKTIVPQDQYAPHLEEWRGRWQGQTPLILAPGSTKELSHIMAYCHEHRLPVVPQGGNTGLVGGQVANGEILISLHRMHRIRDISPTDFTMIVDAGVTLSEVQHAAAEQDRYFPLSIGSEGSCQIGGILSTNAGGVHVIRYGNMRDLVLGLEVVLPDGHVWNGLNRLRKNNTGYDLKHLFIGGEGTLGIISGAVLKLFPQPAEKITAMVSVPDADKAIELLSLLQARTGGQLHAFELMNKAMVRLVLHQLPKIQAPFAIHDPYYVLIECGSGQKGVLQGQLEQALGDAHETQLIREGTIAVNEEQSKNLWSLRHHASEAMKRDPMFCVKCDISVPVRSIPNFLSAANAMIEQNYPGARVIAFGHAGDGNIHYDILGPEQDDNDVWQSKAAEIEYRVHDIVITHEGSISAEHGVGLLKRDELATRKSEIEMDLMGKIKSAFDPHNIMNPGKLL